MAGLKMTQKQQKPEKMPRPEKLNKRSDMGAVVKSGSKGKMSARPR